MSKQFELGMIDATPVCKTPLRRPDIELHELDGEAVVFDARSGAVHRFSAATLFVWDACDGARDVDSMARALSDNFGIDRVEGAALTKKVIFSLSERSLLPEAEEESETPEPGVRRNVESDRPRGLTRRELVRGGVMKAVLAAPLISTFFARPAFASTVSPHGAGGCRNVGYSCTANVDCCESGAGDTECQSSECCILQDKGTCTTDADCCTGLTCDGGGICRS